MRKKSSLAIEYGTSKNYKFIKTITRAASGAITDDARKRTSQKGRLC